MSFKNFFLSAALGTSTIVSGNESASSVDNTQKNTSLQVNTSLQNTEKHTPHSHFEVFAGFEHNHLLENGQFMEGNFSSLGLHGSKNNWGAYYHWLQSNAGIFEHKAGITYSYSFDNTTITAGFSGIYEVTESEHENDISSHKPHHKEDSHTETGTHLSALESTLYAPLSIEMESILMKGKKRETTLALGGEYSIGDINTSFLYANIKHVEDLNILQFTVSAKVIDILDTNSSHIEKGILGVGEFELKVPIGTSQNWSFDIGGQITTRGNKTGKIGFSQTF